MITSLLNSPVMSLTLSLCLFMLGQWIQKKTKSPFANPLLLAQIGLLILIQCTPIKPQTFLDNTQIYNLLLIPATASLAIGIYKNIKILKQYAAPILVGCFAGALTSLVCTVALCRFLGLDETIVMSMAPKSVTSPIALELTAMRGGLAGLAALGVMTTGLAGVVLGPWMIDKLRITDPVAQGVSMGTSAHIMGTVRALEMGQLQGAMAGLSISTTGLFTVLLFLFL